MHKASTYVLWEVLGSCHKRAKYAIQDWATVELSVIQLLRTSFRGGVQHKCTMIRSFQTSAEVLMGLGLITAFVATLNYMMPQAISVRTLP